MNLAINVQIQESATGNRNVNCGSLRRIGKTTALKEMITQYKTDHPDHSIYLLMPVLGMAEQYRDLIRNHIIDQVVSVRNFERNIPRDRTAYVFSDEVPNAQQIAERCQQSYIAGFYSEYNVPDLSRVTEAVRNFGSSMSDMSDALAYAFSSLPADPSAVVSASVDPKQRYKFISRTL